MGRSTICLHSSFAIGPVDPRIFGGFIEHMGRCVYEGLYDPSSPHADESGCRRDVLDALAKLRMTTMRYPGGNFVSGYHWLDGVGPGDQRPVVRDLAWQSIEPNQFGTDEYISLCRKMNWTPMLTVNLGTGTPEEARNWVEYCNSPAGTKYANMRAGNGNAAPHDVKLWCLGNEMDGPWQLGHVPADQYAIRAQQAAKMMKDTDHSIELVACGSCNNGMPTYLQWDEQVLHYLGDFADYVSLHRYVENRAGDTPNFLAMPVSVDQQIEQTDAVCRVVQGRRKSKKRAYLCFDEWNVWYKNTQMDGQGKRAPHLIEEVYNLEDALVVAGFLQSFIRHADCVKIANIAQVVNVIAPILTDGERMLIQSIYWPFEMISKRREGVALRLVIDGPTYSTKEHGEVAMIDASAIMGDGELHVFVTNRDINQPHEVTVNIAGQAILSAVTAELLTGPDAKAANTHEQPGVIRPVDFADQVQIAHGQATMQLPALSFAAVTLKLA